MFVRTPSPIPWEIREWHHYHWYIFDIRHPCYDQLVAVKTRYLPTSITWPYRRLRSRTYQGCMFFWNWRLTRYGFFDWIVGSSYNHGQKSWDKFALLALLRTRQAWIQLHLPNLAPTPHTMLNISTCNFSWFSTLCWRGLGGQQSVYEGYSSVFSILQF